MNIARLDHLVLTVADIARTCDFYTRVLGMEVVTFGEGRTALRFGQQKINLHPADNIPGLVADKPTPGSGDLCFITEMPIAEVVAHLSNAGCRSSPGRGRAPARSARSSRSISATPTRTWSRSRITRFDLVAVIPETPPAPAAVTVAGQRGDI